MLVIRFSWRTGSLVIECHSVVGGFESVDFYSLVSHRFIVLLFLGDVWIILGQNSVRHQRSLDWRDIWVEEILPTAAESIRL